MHNTYLFHQDCALCITLEFKWTIIETWYYILLHALNYFDKRYYDAHNSLQELVSVICMYTLLQEASSNWREDNGKQYMR